MEIRPATTSDAQGIGLVQVRSWQAAYRGFVPDGFLDRMDPLQRAARWTTILTHAGQRESTLVADAGGRVVGFVNAGASRDPDGNGEGEIRALYLLPDRWGQGVGRQLMASALTRLHGSGFDTAVLWVLQGNRRARRFYEAGGWAADGTSKEDDRGGFTLHEVRYRRPLP